MQQLSRDDEVDWDDELADEEEEEANAQAQEELGSWDDGMGDLNSYAFIAYVYVRDRLFIVEINAQTLQGLMAGQGRGTQCLHAMCTHLPEGVAADDVDTVDLDVKKTNEPAIHLYNARKIMVEEREGDVVRGKMQTISGAGPRVYQVDDPPRGQKGDPLPKEATWEYRRASRAAASKSPAPPSKRRRNASDEEDEEDDEDEDEPEGEGDQQMGVRRRHSPRPARRESAQCLGQGSDEDGSADEDEDWVWGMG